MVSEGNSYASQAPHTALGTRHNGPIFRLFCTIYCLVVLVDDFNKFSTHRGWVGCVIPPFLFQTYSASISFGYLAHKDFRNIRIFAVRHVLRSPQSPCLFFIILTKVLSEGNCYASPAPHTALDTRHIGTIFTAFLLCLGQAAVGQEAVRVNLY